MDLEKLKEPFGEKDIEWRLQSCGKNEKGFYGKCLAYVTNRAIQSRLDEVCGPLNWKNEFIAGPNGGILCGLSLRHNNEWITKWDGAENTDIEAVKGGLSDSMKRAAVQWGIGRYLYNLEENWVKVDKEGKYFGSTKEKEKFRWNPPTLPFWALPLSEVPLSNDDKKAITELKEHLAHGILQGNELLKAQLHIRNRDVEGVKKALAYINQKIEKGGN